MTVFSLSHMLILLLGAALHFHITHIRHQADPRKPLAPFFYSCLLKMQLNLRRVWEPEAHLPSATHAFPLRGRLKRDGARSPQNAAEWDLTWQRPTLKSRSRQKRWGPCWISDTFFFYTSCGAANKKKLHFIDHLCHTCGPGRLPRLFMQPARA